MLSLEDDVDRDGGGDARARWFPPSAPPLSPPCDERGLAPHFDAPRAPPAAQAPALRTDFHQYPGVVYGSVAIPPPPGRPEAARYAPQMYVAQRLDAPMRRATSSRRRGVESHRYNLTWAFSAMSRFVLLLFFDAANGVLGLCGAAVVWLGVMLTVATLPLCGFGIVLFHSLLRVACYLCQLDVLIHNVIADADHKITFPPLPPFGRERESLLPTRAFVYDWRVDREPALRFEKTLYEPSPRSILAAIYLGTVKLVLGALGLVAVGLLLADIGFLMGDKRVHVDVPHMDEHPLTVYLVSLTLLLVALVLVHGLAEISQRVTRFFCCEVELSPGM